METMSVASSVDIGKKEAQPAQGKTYAAEKYMVEQMRGGKRFIYTSPTKKLCEQTYTNVLASMTEEDHKGYKAVRVDSDTVDGSVVHSFMRSVLEKDNIIVMTHKGLFNLGLHC